MTALNTPALPPLTYPEWPAVRLGLAPGCQAFGPREMTAYAQSATTPYAAEVERLRAENATYAEMLEHVQERAFNAQDFELCAAIETILMNRHMAEAVSELAALGQP